MEPNTEKPSNWYLKLRRVALALKIFLLLFLIFYLDAKLETIQISAYLIFYFLLEFIYKFIANKNVSSEKRILFALLISDIILTTQILSLTGGPTNPFSILFLVYLVLGAVLLDIKATVIISILTSISFFSLFIFHTPIMAFHRASLNSNFSVHLHGMLISYFFIAFLITYFLTKILIEKRKNVQAIKNIELEKLQFAKVSTITANAAHELGTPLANIALIAEELDCDELRAEIKKCKHITEDLCIKSGSIIGESYSKANLKELILSSLLELNIKAENIDLKLNNINLILPIKATKMAIKALIQNANEASNSKFSISLKKIKYNVVIEIKNLVKDLDFNLNDFYSPFYTSKSNSKNLGLGVYIANSVASELGGSLKYSKEGQFITSKFLLPKA